jgi:hypothetical protein
MQNKHDIRNQHQSLQHSSLCEREGQEPGLDPKNPDIGENGLIFQDYIFEF